MAWTTPRTWTTGELVTAAFMNTHVRDNLLALTAWQAWTPTLTNLNIGSTGTQTARYVHAAGWVHYHYTATLAGSGISVGAVNITLPVEPASHYVESVAIMGNASYLEGGVANYVGNARLDSDGDAVDLKALATASNHLSSAPLSSTVPFTWGATDVIAVSGTYEAA